MGAGGFAITVLTDCKAKIRVERMGSNCPTPQLCIPPETTNEGWLRRPALEDGFNKQDIFNLVGYMEACQLGIPIPRGVGKLKALHTLCQVNIVDGKGKVALKELEELTQLCKLGVVGVPIHKIRVFWSAVAGLSQLRSLSVEADYQNGSRMTAWIHLLQNLSKLTLEYSGLEQDDAIQGLGVLPNLAVLRLNRGSFEGKQLHFQNSSFPSLMVLEMDDLRDIRSVLFEEDAMPRLELLQVALCLRLKEMSGLPVLTSLREIRQDCLPEELKEDVKRQVAEHLKHVRLNITS